jgi:hypothetical protein
MVSPGRPRTSRRRGRTGPVRAALALLGVFAAGALAYLWLARESPEVAPAPEPTGPPIGEAAPDATPEGPATPADEEPAPPPEVPAEPLPALDASDAWLRAEAGSLSAHPALARWLASGDLVRRFVASVDNVADGESPRAHLPFLAPREPFRTVTRAGRTVTDPRSFARYDAVAEAVESLDAGRCAALYRRAKPLVEEAFRALGPGDGSFDDRLARGLRTLLETPVPTGDEELVRPKVFHEYADPELESLDPAQKHLLRMGPANVRRIQAKLRELASALGIEVSR